MPEKNMLLKKMYFVLLFSEKITWPIIDFLTDSVATETSQKERCTGIELCPRPSAEQQSGYPPPLRV